MFYSTFAPFEFLSKINGIHYCTPAADQVYFHICRLSPSRFSTRKNINLLQVIAPSFTPSWTFPLSPNRVQSQAISAEYSVLLPGGDTQLPALVTESRWLSRDNDDHLAHDPFHIVSDWRARRHCAQPVISGWGINSGLYLVDCVTVSLRFSQIFPAFSAWECEP